MGYRLTREETYHVVTITTDRDTGVGLVDYSDTLPFLDPNAERDTVMASIQDQMEVNPSLSVLYGINVEKTSMTDTQYDPRISVVYQEDAQNIFKAIYSHSHRNPSWQELFVINTAARVGNPDLKPEQVYTFELAAIRKFSGSNYLQAVAFYAINKDLIDKDPQTRVYENAYDNELYGIELELYTNLTPHDSFYLGYSYITGRSSDGNALANVAHHLVKSYYQYDFSPSVNAAAIVRYVGAKTRLDGDTRSDTDPYLTTDLTLRYVYLPQRFSVTGSIKNVTDARIVYPSEPYTYVNDYPQEGRTFFLTLMKEF